MSAPLLRLDSKNVFRCAVPRRRGQGLECDTPIARPAGSRLVIRCRNCHTDHVFAAVDGRIVSIAPGESSCRLPETTAVS